MGGWIRSHESQMIKEQSVLYVYCFKVVSGWVDGSWVDGMACARSLSLCLTHFTSQCNGSEYVRTFVVVMVTNRKG